MGLVSSTFDMVCGTRHGFKRQNEAKVSWTISNEGLGSQWQQYALRRYGSGFSATGVPTSVALPPLLQRRLLDWTVKGFSVDLGAAFISFGRVLEASSGGQPVFFGTDIFFGDNSARASWFFPCQSHEWLLQLHKAVLEPVPDLPPATSDLEAPPAAGRPRYLRHSRDEAAGQFWGDEQEDDVSAARGAAAAAETSRRYSSSEGHVAEQHMVLFLSNHEGRVGILTVPVPNRNLQAVQAVMRTWAATCEVPLLWGGRLWRSSEDFFALRDGALNMPDLFLLGVDAQLAMALTPDWSWEQYPLGFGLPALPKGDLEDTESAIDMPSESSVALSSPPSRRGSRRDPNSHRGSLATVATAAAAISPSGESAARRVSREYGRPSVEVCG
eukprot:TRINITY_DN80470_c0_g1_i1.p1 TRINITY_DN80470_c0_g1~~TRINITY_DN80470_c0_g1_i1.p1  ORF type:complete len:385 (-),score=50.01 TRINITY_DN80470_c0_g1_i1:87-1241(-)